MAVIRTPRSHWVEAGLGALAAGGLDAVRIEPLAHALGVTKGGFYWHFEGRDALLAEMLDAWERMSIDDVIARVDAEGGDARTRLRTLFGIASLNEEILRVDLAVRGWARRDAAVAARLRSGDNRRMDYMRALVAAFCADEEEVEVRCTIAFSIWIGNHFMAADHGARSRDEVLGLVLKRLLA